MKSVDQRANWYRLQKMLTCMLNFPSPFIERGFQLLYETWADADFDSGKPMTVEFAATADFA